jgi:SAM-dependent methyltransferase
MRELIKQFVKICAETLPISEPIYEFGSLQVPGQEGFADLRPFFPDKRYIGADMRKGTGVDVILNLHQIDLSSGSVGTVLILDTLEHVEFPRKAIEESYRILKPNGILIISSVMNFPIHDYPHDYWRFTPEAFKSLLCPFKSSIVEFAGKSDFPHTVIGIGLKGLIAENAMSEFARKLKDWKKHWRSFKNLKEYWCNPRRGGWKGLVKLVVPSVSLTIYQKIRKIPS